MQQARAVYRMSVELHMTADVALYLQVGQDELIRRLLARAQQEGRSDDTEQVIARRLALYRQVTEPILGWYEGRGILVSVAAERPVEDVTREVLVALEVLQVVIGQVPDSDRRSIDLTGLDTAFGAEAEQGSPTAGRSGGLRVAFTAPVAWGACTDGGLAGPPSRAADARRPGPRPAAGDEGVACCKRGE